MTAAAGSARGPWMRATAGACSMTQALSRACTTATVRVEHSPTRAARYRGRAADGAGLASLASVLFCRAGRLAEQEAAVLFVGSVSGGRGRRAARSRHDQTTKRQNTSRDHSLCQRSVGRRILSTETRTALVGGREWSGGSLWCRALLQQRPRNRVGPRQPTAALRRGALRRAPIASRPNTKIGDARANPRFKPNLPGARHLQPVPPLTTTVASRFRSDSGSSLLRFGRRRGQRARVAPPRATASSAMAV